MITKIYSLYRPADRWVPLAFGLALVSIGPIAIWFGPTNLFPIQQNEINTMIGSALACVVGYVLALKTIEMPNVEPLAATVSSFVWSYTSAAVIFFLFRVEYTRAEFILSFLLCIIWFWLTLKFAATMERRRLTVVPFGAVEDIQSIEWVDWSVATDPHMDLPQTDGVVADLRADLTPEWQEWLTRCVLNGTQVFHVKTLRESLTGRLEIEHLSENTLGSINPDSLYLSIKRIVDTVLAVVALICLAPVFLVVALIIRKDSPGPVLFTQKRVGYRGDEFTIYKFRTMAHRAAERADEKAFHAAKTVDDDPRISKVGRWLRKWRIDELPQIVNIIRGEMSWIGPRPEATPLSRWYQSQLPFYDYRHIVRPGLSGWAQVNQGHVTGDGEVLEKLHYDFYYIRNLSPWLDLVIVTKTIETVFTGFGAR